MLLNNFAESLLTGVASNNIPFTSMFNDSISSINNFPTALSLPVKHSYENILSDEFSKTEKMITVVSAYILPLIISPTDVAPTIIAVGKTFLIVLPNEKYHSLSLLAENI